MFSAINHQCAYWQRYAKILLAVFWSCGLLLGLSAANAAGDILLHLMRRLFLQSMSIVGLLIRFSFSFLITALAVILLKPWLLLPAAFVKSFLLAFFLEGMMVCYSCSAGAVHYFLCCNVFLSAASLLWFWFRHISGFRVGLLRDLFLCIILCNTGEFVTFYFYVSYYA